VKKMNKTGLTIQVPTVKFKRVHPQARLPSRSTEGAAGWDLYALCITEEDRPNKSIVPPHTTKLIRTGWHVEPPPGHMLMICSRSGLAKHSLFVANAPGIVDSDYRGEIQVLLFNGSFSTYYVQHDDRIAQMLVVPLIPSNIAEVQELSSTSRGEAGFGSTGR
jgi:dUTP pyrophosphatase